MRLSSRKPPGVDRLPKVPLLRSRVNAMGKSFQWNFLRVLFGPHGSRGGVPSNFHQQGRFGGHHRRLWDLHSREADPIERIELGEQAGSLALRLREDLEPLAELIRLHGDVAAVGHAAV